MATLEFDFTNQVAGTAALNTANTYDKLSIFFDFGVNGNDGSLYYVDNVSLDLLSVKDSDFKLSLYPNPVKDIAMISSAESVDLVRVFDLTGRMLSKLIQTAIILIWMLRTFLKVFTLLNAGNKEATTKLIK